MATDSTINHKNGRIPSHRVSQKLSTARLLACASPSALIPHTVGGPPPTVPIPSGVHHRRPPDRRWSTPDGPDIVGCATTIVPIPSVVHPWWSPARHVSTTDGHQPVGCPPPTGPMAPEVNHRRSPNRRGSTPAGHHTIGASPPTVPTPSGVQHRRSPNRRGSTTDGPQSVGGPPPAVHVVGVSCKNIASCLESGSDSGNQLFRETAPSVRFATPAEALEARNVWFKK